MKEKFLEIYRKNITRPGADKLLAWLETTDFFTAPASTRFHLSRPGGLVDHSVHVYERLDNLVTDEEGYKRLKKVLDAWGKNYDKYFDALTKKPEADYARAKIDAAMKLICGDSQDFIPFEQRYEWLPEIRYDRRG